MRNIDISKELEDGGGELAEFIGKIGNKVLQGMEGYLAPIVGCSFYLASKALINVSYPNVDQQMRTDMNAMLVILASMAGAAAEGDYPNRRSPIEYGMYSLCYSTAFTLASPENAGLSLVVLNSSLPKIAHRVLGDALEGRIDNARE